LSIRAIFVVADFAIQIATVEFAGLCGGHAQQRGCQSNCHCAFFHCYILYKNKFKYHRTNLIRQYCVPTYCGRIVHSKNNCSSLVAKIQRSKPSALPSRLTQTNTGTHRNIQTFHTAQHRDAHQFVAGLARQAAQITRGEVSAEPALVLWLFGIPLIDTLVVMARRMKRKQSPFAADRTHIHHVLEHAGLSVGRTVLVLCLVQLVLVGTGVCFYLIHAPAAVVFWSFVLLMAAYYYCFRKCQDRGLISLVQIVLYCAPYRLGVWIFGCLNVNFLRSGHEKNRIDVCIVVYSFCGL